MHCLGQSKVESVLEDTGSVRTKKFGFGMKHVAYDDPLLGFLPDPEYKAAKEETKRIRESMYPPWSQQKESERSQPAKASSKSPAKRPPTCDCPATFHPPAGSQGTASTTRPILTIKLGRGKLTTSNASGDGDAAKNHEDKSLQRTNRTLSSPDISAEALAKACTHCQKIKQPPPGKKIAWRKRTSKWMYVHRDAPDEEGRAEPEDDAEPLRGPRIDFPKPAAEGDDGVYAANKDEQRQQLDDGGLLATETRDNSAPVTQTNDGDESGIMATTEMEDTIFVPQQPPTQQVVSASTRPPEATATQQSEPTLTQEHGDAREQHRSEERNENVVFTNQNSTILVRAAPTAEKSMAETANNRASPPPSVATDVEIATNSVQTPEPAPEGIDEASKKRQNEPEHEVPAPKKERIDIDLTIDDNDELVAVKSEYGDTTDPYSSTLDEKKRRLEEVKRKRRILAMKLEDEEQAAEEAKLELEIARSEGRGGKANRVKDEAVIKIEG